MQRDNKMYSTCFIEIAYYESSMIKKKNNQMQYWLMKSEPDVWSIDQQKKAGTKGSPWDGVRNYQAAKT